MRGEGTKDFVGVGDGEDAGTLLEGGDAGETLGALDGGLTDAG